MGGLYGSSTKTAIYLRLPARLAAISATPYQSAPAMKLAQIGTIWVLAPPGRPKSPPYEPEVPSENP